VPAAFSPDKHGVTLKKTSQPPTRDGVGPSCVTLPVAEWVTVFDFLAGRFPAISRQEWRERMLRGDVVDAHGEPLLPAHPYAPHARVYYYRSLPEEPRIPFEEKVLYQDDYLVVVDKPNFLPVTPSGRYLQETLLVRLKRRLGIDTLAPMHRIDRETSGLVLFTVRPETRNGYQALFRERAVDKSYEAIAPWRPDLALPTTYRSRLVEGDSFMRMREVPGEPNAETLIEALEVRNTLARYRLSPLTGQKHQLRVQMAALGMPILNDRIYPVHYPETTEAGDYLPPDYARPLQLLAASIRFTDPVSHQERHFDVQRHLDF
jgi:tRNA pseudouridine32 synthase/23S rRNA pseudouridine746 synthase